MKKIIKIALSLSLVLALVVVEVDLKSFDGASIEFIGEADAGCEIESYQGWVIGWVTVYKCDSTPNETCSAEGTSDDGNAYSFSCDGKETFRHKKFGGPDPESLGGL